MSDRSKSQHLAHRKHKDHERKLWLVKQGELKLYEILALICAVYEKSVIIYNEQPWVVRRSWSDRKKNNFTSAILRAFINTIPFQIKIANGRQQDFEEMPDNVHRILKDKNNFDWSFLYWLQLMEKIIEFFKKTERRRMAHSTVISSDMVIRRLSYLSNPYDNVMFGEFDQAGRPICLWSPDKHPMYIHTNAVENNTLSRDMLEYIYFLAKHGMLSINEYKLFAEAIDHVYPHTGPMTTMSRSGRLAKFTEEFILNYMYKPLSRESREALQRQYAQFHADLESALFRDEDPWD